MEYTRGGDPEAVGTILPRVTAHILEAALRPTVAVYEELGHRRCGSGAYVAIGSALRNPASPKPITGIELLERTTVAIGVLRDARSRFDPQVTEQLQGLNARTLRSAAPEREYQLRWTGPADRIPGEFQSVQTRAA